MPIYIFFNPKTKETIEVIQSIKEDHIYVDKNGFKWDRIFTKPNAGIDTKIDPFSKKEFREKTSNKNYTVGDLWASSGEASEKRDKITGKDPIREKYLENYSKRRKGRKHPSLKGPDIHIV